MKRTSSCRRSPIVARPRQTRPASADRLKMSTNCTAWLRSMMDCDVISETATKSPTFTSIVQIVACAIGSSPSRPNSAYGLSRAMPSGPFSTKLWVIQPERAKDGSSSV